MKCKLFSTAIVFFLTLGFAQGQSSTESVDCGQTLQLYAQSAKIKDYKSALPEYEKLIENCPGKSLAIYQYGKRMFDYFLDQEKEKGEENMDKARIKELAEKKIKNNNLRLKHFPKKSNPQEIKAKNAQVMFDNDLAPKDELYKKFDEAWSMSEDGFTNPKPIYTYFRLLLDLYNDDERDVQLVFDRYDALSAKIQKEENKQAAKAKPVIKKQEDGEELDKKEKRIIHNSELYLRNYNNIENSLDKLLGDLANCENLIPLYEGKFDEKKNDTTWLKSAASRLSAEECTDSDMFYTIVETLQEKNPSSKTAFYLGQLAQKDGKTSKAIKYFEEAADLENNKLDKAKVLYKLGGFYKSKGSYSTARSFYRKALDNNPSMGKAYLNIAEMYSKSVNNCGKDPFSKRAVYWLAANYASRAARVDASIKDRANKTASSYRGRAPSKKDIFQSDYKEGQSIKIGCWIGESVTVPKI